MLDAFPERIAVLDERGVIVSVNAAWRAARADSVPGCDGGVGASYLAECERAGELDPSARDALRAMLDGTRTQPFETRGAWASDLGRPPCVVRVLRAPELPLRVLVVLEEITASAGTPRPPSTTGLVAGVAHEVRNPLFAISSTLDAFEAEVGEGGPHTECLRVVRAEVARVSELVDDLIDYERTPALDVAPIATSEVVREALASCADLLRSLEVTVRLEVALDSALVTGDAKRLVQMFRNVLENAIQHSPRGGEVVVEIEEHVHEVRCRVLDRGPGFRPEDLPRLFEPFFTRRRGGMGLGLAIVQRIAHEHGGDVTASTRAGGGASVLLRLPTHSRVTKTSATS